MPLPCPDNSLQVRAREGGATGEPPHVAEKYREPPLAMAQANPISGSTKKFVSTLTTDVLADVLRQVRKVGANFARPFSLSAFLVQWPGLSPIEPGAADGRRVRLPAATIRPPFRNRPRTQPILNPRRLPVSLASCCRRPSSRSPTKASEDFGTLRTMSTSPSEAAAGTNSRSGTMPGIDAENR